MNRLKRIISPIMVLVILLSNLQLPYQTSEMAPQVYAAESASDISISAEPMGDATNRLLSVKSMVGAASSTVTEFVYSVAEIVELDKDWLTADLELNGDYYTGLESVYSDIEGDLDLPVEGPYGSTIAWVSTNQEVIANNGTVNRPTNAQGDMTVHLRALISRETTSWLVFFSVVVKPLEPTYEDSFLALDKAWLTAVLILNGNNYVEDVWEGTVYFDNITSDLNLPVEGPNGCTISWASTNQAIVALDGTVTRPSSIQGTLDVELTATLTKNEAKVYIKFLLVLPPLEQTPDDLAVLADYDWLVPYILNYNSSAFLDMIMEDLYLPTLGENGSTISWTSSDETVAAANGKVTRPSYTQGYKAVILTAHISKGASSAHKEFQATIVALDISNEERVSLDKVWLTDELILNGNSVDDVKRRLNLPDSGEKGSTIIWTSTNSNVVDPDDGSVTRPTEAQGDQAVTLTATIYYGEPGTEDRAEAELTYDMIVTIIEEFYLSLNYEDFSNLGDDLQFDGMSGIINTTDRDGSSIQALQFNNSAPSSGGSVFTKDKLRLKDDMSFSTTFTYQNKHSNFALGDGGFTFTLKAGDSTTYDNPSLSIDFDTQYITYPDIGQYTPYGFNESISVFYNGINDATYDNGRHRGVASGRTYDPAGFNCVWIEYDGLSRMLEIRFSSNTERPRNPTIQLSNVDLGEIFANEENNLSLAEVQDVYAGFTGSVGNAKDKSEISGWNFKNDSSPIDFAPYIFIDASNMTLSDNSIEGQTSKIVAASVYGRDGLPAAGVPVYFSTDLGTLDSSSAITDASGETSVVLSSVISGLAFVEAVAEGGANASIEVPLAVTDKDSVGYDTQWLTNEKVLNGNSALDNITKNLYMPSEGRSGSNIAWTSSKAGMVAIDGTVNTPSPVEGDQEVVLTATIRKGDELVEKIFNITVKVLDEDKVGADRDWLTDNLVLDGNSAFNNITKSLRLPEIGPSGSNISWTSTNESVVTTDGAVTRPAYTQGDKAVTLTAIISKGSSEVEKRYNITVKALAETNAEALAADNAWLTDTIILNGNINLSNVLEDLNLPVLGTRGSIISWTATGTAVSIPDGTVSRPTYTQGDEAVTLTATITKGTESTKKTFSLIVRKLAQTIEEAVASDSAWLDASRTLDSNLSQYSISSNLVLPALGPEGSSITWTTNMPGVISNSGVVTRSEYLEGHKSVILTATLKKGAVQIIKELEYTVLRIPDLEPPRIISTSPVNSSTGVIWDTRQIVITFSEEIKYGKEGNINNDIYFFSPDYQNTSKRIDKNRLIITLDQDMKFGARCFLSIYRGDITDMSGNPLNDHFYYSFTVEQKLNNKIEVISSSPEDRDRQVTVKPEISFAFSHSDIVQGSTFDNISLRIRDGEAVPVTRSLNSGTVTLGLGTGAELTPGTVYEMFIPEGAVRDRFKNESSARTILFITQGDEKKPEVISTYPSEGQNTVDIHQNIIINFSELVKVKDNYIKLVDNKGGFIGAALDRMSASKWIHIRTYETLQPNTEYTVTLPYNYVSSLSGNNMEFDYTMSFTTGANSLSIDKIYPTAIYENIGAPLNAPVEVEFKAPVTRGPEFDNIEITDSEGYPVTIQLDENDNKVILTPALPLETAETYDVYIPAGAYKNESNALNDALNFKFAAAGRLELYGATFTANPSARWLVKKPLLFDTQWIEKKFNDAKYKIASFEWSFGDGCTGSGKNPEHIYNISGDYNVILRLQDHKGVSYEFEQKVTIEDLKASEAEMSVDAFDTHVRELRVGQYHSIEPSQTFVERPLFVDGISDYEKDYRVYKIHLGQNGIPIPEESIKVLLYKNGALQKDLGTVTTAKVEKYIGSFGREFVVGGGAEYNFYYDGKGYFGTYELVFVYGSQEEGSVVRIPVKIREVGVKQTLGVKLYNQDSGNFVENPKVMAFEVDGEKKHAELQWYDAEVGYCYMIKDVDADQLHTLKLATDGWIRYSSDLEHAYPNMSMKILKVKPRVMGINRIKTNLPRSEFHNTSFFIEGVSMPPVAFEFEGDWTGLTPGYYEISADKKNSSWKSTEPRFELNPGSDLHAGEGLFIRMVSMEGLMSPWIDANVVVAPKPSLDFGPTLDVNYIDGEYRLNGTMIFEEVMGGRIGILNGVPLLDNGKSFGLGNDKHRLESNMFRGMSYSSFDIRVSSESTYEEEMKKAKLVSTGYEIGSELNVHKRLVFNYTSQDWILEYEEVTLLGDGNYYWKKGYKVPKIGVGATAKLKMGSVVGGTLIIDRSEFSEREYSGIIYFEPYVKASIEFGEPGLNVEGSVEGRINSEVHIPTGYVQAEPKITAKITAHYLTYSSNLYSRSIMNEHWDNEKEKVHTAAFKAAQPLMVELDTDTAKLTPMSRNYLNRESQWLSGSQEKQGKLLLAARKISPLMKGAEATNPQLETKKENIYPDSEVQLIRNGDELWMVWTDDNPERSAMNRTQMRYSVLKDGIWSEPAWIGQDGTADFSPVSASADGGVLVAWQNIRQTMPEDAELGEFIENAEISVTESVYKVNGSDVNIVTLTDDDKFDHSPKLAADGEKALLVWTKAEGLGFTLGSDMEDYRSPENSDSLLFSRWNGSSWSIPAEIEGSLPTVMNSSLSMYGDEGLFLYTLDTDNDQSTEEDREVYARRYDGDSWGEKIRITDNRVSDSNPKAVYSNGDWFITWYQDGSIVYKEGLLGETQIEESLLNVESNYEIAVKDGKRQQIALVYKQMGNNNARTLSTSIYDIDKDVWSHEIPLTKGVGYVRSFSPVFSEDEKLNIAYTQAEIITEVIEGDEYLTASDKVDLNILTYTPIHDLALDTEDNLQLSTEDPLPGTMVTILATIRNQGDFAENATLYLYDGKPSEGVKIGEVTTKQPIPARSSAEVKVEWIVDSEERYEYDIYAVIQPDEDVTEINESNNNINRKISTLDIAVENLNCENLAKDEYLVTASVANLGNKSLEGIKVQLEQSIDGQVLETRGFTQIMSRQAEGLSFLISSQGLEVDENGEINMTLRALLPEDIEENSTDNNTYEFVLQPDAIVVERMNPVSGETRVGIQKSLTIGFNMNVEEGDGFDQITLEDDSLNRIEINKTLEGKTLKVTPKNALAYNCQYTLTIPKEAIGDSYGHIMENPYSLSFVTTTSSPEIVFAYPGGGMGNVAIDADIKMQYNQKVLVGPTYGDIAMYGPDLKEISAEVTQQGEWIYIRPTGQLNENATYSLIIPRGAVKNDKGEAQQEDYVLEFTTAKAEDIDDPEKPEEEEADKVEHYANQQTYKISRHISVDGSSTVIVDIDEQVIMKQTDDNVSMVTLDLTDDVKEDETIKVNLSESALKQLMTNKQGLSLVTGKGDVRIPADLIASFVKEGKYPITITIAKNDEELTDDDRVSSGIFDFSITAGEELVTEFEPEVIVTIPLDMSEVRYAKRIIACVYDEATDSWHPVGGVADAIKGAVTFSTGHFSTYAAFETIRHFDDVTSSWAKEKVEILASRRLIEGNGNNVFAPDDSITRAEFTAMIVRSLYTELSTSKDTFEDVAEDAWFEASVETAYKLGLVNGSGPSKFDPNSEISREQLATIAYRLYRYKAGTETIGKISNTFKDRQDISSYAEEAVDFVALTKIMTGSDGRFEPGRSATRQETAVVLYRLLEYMGEL